VHLVTGSYFRSRNKDGGHAIRSAVAKYPMPQAHFTALMYSGRGVIGDEMFTMWGSGFVLARRFLLREYWIFLYLFFAPVTTLTLTRWPSYTNLTRTPGRYTGCANMNFLRQGFRMLSSDRQYRQTDRIYQKYKPCRFVGGKNVMPAHLASPLRNSNVKCIHTTAEPAWHRHAVLHARITSLQAGSW